MAADFNTRFWIGLVPSKRKSTDPLDALTTIIEYHESWNSTGSGPYLRAKFIQDIADDCRELVIENIGKVESLIAFVPESTLIVAKMLDVKMSAK